MSMQEVDLGARVVLKYDFKGLLKKHIVDDTTAFSFEDLKRLISSAYGAALGEGKEFSVFYVDEEGDSIAVSNDFELADAFRIAQASTTAASNKIPTLRVSIVVANDDDFTLLGAPAEVASDSESDSEQANKGGSHAVSAPAPEPETQAELQIEMSNENSGEVFSHDMSMEAVLAKAETPEPESEPAPSGAAESSGGRGSLLDAIREGTVLKKAKQYPKREYPRLWPSVDAQSPQSIPADVEVESVASDLDSIFNETVSALDANLESTQIASAEVIAPVDAEVIVPVEEKPADEIDSIYNSAVAALDAEVADLVQAEVVPQVQAASSEEQSTSNETPATNATNESSATTDGADDEDAALARAIEASIQTKIAEDTGKARSDTKAEAAQPQIAGGIANLLSLLPLPLAASPLVAPVLQTLQETLAATTESGKSDVPATAEPQAQAQTPPQAQNSAPITGCLEWITSPRFARAFRSVYESPVFNAFLADVSKAVFVGGCRAPEAIKTAIAAHINDFLPLFADMLTEVPELLPLVPIVLKMASALRVFAPSADVDNGKKNKVREVGARCGRGKKKCKNANSGKARRKKELHIGVYCDACHSDAVRMRKARANNTISGPKKGLVIKGPRFKSMSMRNFDLCQTCIDGGSFEDGYGPFKRISTNSFVTESEGEPSAVNSENVESAVHARVLCDRCEDDKTGETKAEAIRAGTICSRTGSILGVRYKSVVHDDYDLCATCEEKAGADHVNAPFLKIVRPSQAPAATFCVLPGNHASPPTERELRPESDPNWRRTAKQKFRQFMRSSRGGRCRGFGRRGHCQGPRRHFPCGPPAPSQEPQRRMHPCAASQASCSKQAEDFASAVHEYVLNALNMNEVSLDADDQNVALAKAIEASIHTKIAEEIDSACANKGKGKAKQEHKAASAGNVYVQAEKPAGLPKEVRPKSKFVADVTLPDASLVTPGVSLVKTWRIKNDGKCAWPKGTRMVCVGGATFGTSKEGVQVPCVAPGEETEFSINITAPAIPGRYVSYWRMMTPEPGNKRFGHRFWIDLTVKSAPKHTVYASPGVTPVAETVNLGSGSASTSTPSKFLEASLDKLVAMGFARTENLVRIAREEAGNVQMVVTRLLNQQASDKV